MEVNETVTPMDTAGIIMEIQFQSIKFSIEFSSASPPRAHQNVVSSTELHVAHISTDTNCLICDEDTDISSDLSPRQTVWLGGPGNPVCFVYVKILNYRVCRTRGTTTPTCSSGSYPKSRHWSVQSPFSPVTKT